MPTDMPEDTPTGQPDPDSSSLSLSSQVTLDSVKLTKTSKFYLISRIHVFLAVLDRLVAKAKLVIKE